MENTIKYNGLVYKKHPNQNYYYNTNSKPYRCLHRQKWYDKYGIIPENHHIHHVDGNSLNNELDNLQCIHKTEHLREHSKNRSRELVIKWQKAGVEKAKLWHKSKEGIEWHRQNAINCNFGKKTYGIGVCECCKKEYEIKRGGAKFCSTACKSKNRRGMNVDIVTNVCPICSVEFTTNKYFPRVYCSTKCKPAPNIYGRKGKP